MKARLIRKGSKYSLLCQDGSIARADNLLLYQLLTNFSRTDDYFSGKEGRWDDKYGDMSLVPGMTYALLTDDKNLVISDFAPFETLLNAKLFSDSYVSASEFAKRNGKSAEIVKVYCRQGRIVGAKKVGRSWMIPAHAGYPVDPIYQKVGHLGPRKSKAAELDLPEGYVTCSELGYKFEVPQDTILYYCRKGKIPGAIYLKENGLWVVPKDAKLPVETPGSKEPEDNEPTAVKSMKAVMQEKYPPSDYLSVEGFANKKGLSRQWVWVCAKKGRIPGAVFDGGKWFIPVDSEIQLTGQAKVNEETE